MPQAADPRRHRNVASEFDALSGEVSMKRTLLGAVATAALLASGLQSATADTMKIGVMATLEGTYTVLGEDVDQ